MDHSGVHAQEEDYLFVAEQKCQILAVQRQIDVSLKMGKVTTSQDGSKIMKGGDAFSIFKNIPDTPSYWKTLEMKCSLEWNNLVHFICSSPCPVEKSSGTMF